jgi:hypothetical protein
MAIGGTVVTIWGSYFGPSPSSSDTTVTIGGSSCPVIAGSHNYILCAGPVGSGIQTIRVSVAGQVGSTLNSYTYTTPSITSVSGCSDQSTSTISCPTSPTSSNQLTITGNNFGNNGTLIRVIIGGQFQCNNVSIRIAHTTITCNLPSAFGYNLSVIVTVNSLASLSFTPGVSYLGPLISSYSLKLVSGSITYGSGGYATVLCGNSTYGRDLLQFSGSGFGNIPSAVRVVYGTLSFPSLYNCTNFDVIDNRIQCWTTAGVGKDLRFTVYVSNVPSPQGLDTFSYPAPTLKSGSLAVPGQPVSAAVVGNSTQGQELVFSGNNFGFVLSSSSSPIQSYLRVQYGVPGNETNDSTTSSWNDCVLLSPIGDPNTNIRCVTQPGDTQFNIFKVSHGTGTSTQSGYGSDTYSFPIPPVVTRVSGCIDVDNTTIGCPTDGISSTTSSSITLTIFGSSFGTQGASVTIGGNTCFNTLHVSGYESTQLTCTLPIGVGFNRRIVVTNLPRFSQGFPLLDYATPTLTRVYGCPTTNGINTADCLRTGGSNITIQGINFGNPFFLSILWWTKGLIGMGDGWADFVNRTIGSISNGWWCSLFGRLSYCSVTTHINIMHIILWFVTAFTCLSTHGNAWVLCG